uniref:Uncharacterized protein n=1 Tax=Rhizophora mucronata TaxID=61149 RepID=A0A2P2N113_RHIMU
MISGSHSLRLETSRYEKGMQKIVSFDKNWSDCLANCKIKYGGLWQTRKVRNFSEL